MKGRPTAFVFERDGGAWPFNRPAAQRREKALDSGPLKVAVDRIGPDCRERTAVLAIHRENDSTLTAACKRGDDCRNLTSL